MTPAAFLKMKKAGETIHFRCSPCIGLDRTDSASAPPIDVIVQDLSVLTLDQELPLVRRTAIDQDPASAPSIDVMERHQPV